MQINHGILNCGTYAYKNLQIKLCSTHCIMVERKIWCEVHVCRAESWRTDSFDVKSIRHKCLLNLYCSQYELKVVQTRYYIHKSLETIYPTEI